MNVNYVSDDGNMDLLANNSETAKWHFASRAWWTPPSVEPFRKCERSNNSIQLMVRVECVLLSSHPLSLSFLSFELLLVPSILPLVSIVRVFNLSLTRLLFDCDCDQVRSRTREKGKGKRENKLRSISDNDSMGGKRVNNGKENSNQSHRKRMTISPRSKQP